MLTRTHYTSDAEDYPKEKTAYTLRATDRVIQRAAPLGVSIAARFEPVIATSIEPPSMVVVVRA